ncbi:MAG: NCS2 family permease [Oscillospiraceae bacterium]|nr:NCS2 family permease [Oscillospiraceae bacterium]
MEKLFKLKHYGTAPGKEIIAGVTTFATMVYIVFVNPNILSHELGAGMNRNGVFVATCIAAATGTLIMAIYANMPYAQAPGMGINTFFSFTVCGAMGFTWQEALAMVFLCSVITMILTVTSVRKSLILAIPRSLQNAIGGGIGFFIAYIGMTNAGFLQFGLNGEISDNVIPGNLVVPALSDFSTRGAQLALIGLVIITALMLLKIPGALLIGVAAATVIGIPMGVTDIAGLKLFDMSAVGDIKEVSFAFFGESGFGSMFNSPQKTLMAVTAIFAFSLTDVFNAIGSFIGAGRASGIFTDADAEALRSSKGVAKTRIERALFADMSATCIGSLSGTSNVTTYVESAAGISAGGRTGMTSLVTGILFLLCIPFASLFGIVPTEATAPVLIVVGVLMANSFARVNWTNFEDALPAFLTVAVMALGFSIAGGIAAGFIFYCVIKICTRKFKEIHPILAISAGVFLMSFVVQAL